MKSLRDALDGHRNSLGLVRLVLASAVIFDHAFPLGGWGTAPFLAMTKGQQSLGGLAVLGFLGISGYLVTKSAMGADVLQFMWRRFLRIFPGFWGALLVGAFIVGPALWLAAGHNIVEYFGFGSQSPWGYVYNNVTLVIGQYGIQNLLAGTTPFGLAGNGGPINGSIWTLTYEWLCYLMIAGLLVAGVIARAKILIPAIAAFFFIMRVVNEVVPNGAGQIIPFFNDPWRLNFGFIFFIGAAIAAYSHRVPFDHRLGVISGLGSLALLRLGGFDEVGYVLFAYFVLYLAAALPRQVQWIGQKNDYSYGVYLYGWISQQVLAYLGVYRWGYVPFVLLSLMMAGGCAWLSWHLIEKQALKLKSWGPGRGIPYWTDGIRARFRPRPQVEAAPAATDATPAPGLASE